MFPFEILRDTNQLSYRLLTKMIEILKETKTCWCVGSKGQDNLLIQFASETVYTGKWKI